MSIFHFAYNVPSRGNKDLLKLRMFSVFFFTTERWQHICQAELKAEYISTAHMEPFHYLKNIYIWQTNNNVHLQALLPTHTHRILWKSMKWVFSEAHDSHDAWENLLKQSWEECIGGISPGHARRETGRSLLDKNGSTANQHAFKNISSQFYAKVCFCLFAKCM